MQVGSVGNTSLSQGTDNARLRAVRGLRSAPLTTLSTSGGRTGTDQRLLPLQNGSTAAVPLGARRDRARRGARHRHYTIRRKPAAAAAPSVIGGPGLLFSGLRFSSDSWLYTAPFFGCDQPT